MELPFAYFRIKARMEMFAITLEDMSFISTRTGLATIGRKYPKLLRHLPETKFWNSRTKTQSQEDSLQEQNEFWKMVQSADISERFIVKLEGTSRGRGVQVVHGKERLEPRQFLKLNNSGCVGQQYLNRPCLLPSLDFPGEGGFKWDLRLYLLVVQDNSANAEEPIIIYQYKDAFARRCFQRYSLDTNDREAHITNTAINNKFGDRHICRRAIEILDLTEGMEEMQKLEFASPIADKDDYEEAERNLNEKLSHSELPVTMMLDLVWETLVSTGRYTQDEVTAAIGRMEEMVQDLSSAVIQNYHQNHKSNVERMAVYKKHLLVLGLDIFFDQDLKPYLLEVNRSPDFRCYSLDQLRVKQQLIYDTIECTFPGGDLSRLFSSCQAIELDDHWSELNPRIDCNDPTVEAAKETVKALEASSRWTKVVYSS